MKKWLVVVIVVLLGIVIWRRERASGPEKPRPLTANTPAPAFVVTDLNGKQIDSQQLRGKVVLVDFWATWCGPCEAEIPRFVEWQQRYGEKGLQIVGLSMDDSTGPVKSFVEQHKVSYPIAMADERTLRAFGGVLGLPVNILIDREGRILAKHVGVEDLNAFQREVEAALR